MRHARGKRPDRRELLGAGSLGLRPLEVVHVLRDQEHPSTGHRHHLAREPERRTIRPGSRDLVPLGAPGREHARQACLVEWMLLRSHVGQPVRTDHLGALVLRKHPVDEADDAVRVDHHDVDGRVVHHGVEHCPRFGLGGDCRLELRLGSLPLGDVAQQRNRVALGPEAHGRGVIRDLDGEFGAAPAQRRKLDGATEQVRPTGQLEARDARVVLRAIALGHDEARELLPRDLPCREAEQQLRSPIPEHHQPVVVDHHDGIQRRRGQCLELLLHVLVKGLAPRALLSQHLERGRRSVAQEPQTSGNRHSCTGLSDIATKAKTTAAAGLGRVSAG